MCTLGFIGKGYSPEFVEHFKRLVKNFGDPESGNDVQIKVIDGLDSICTGCPNHADGVCASELKICQLDRAHAKILGIRVGDVLSWSEAKKRISENMSIESFELACASCAWKSMGACRDALVKLKAEK